MLALCTLSRYIQKNALKYSKLHIQYRPIILYLKKENCENYKNCQQSEHTIFRSAKLSDKQFSKSFNTRKTKFQYTRKQRRTTVRTQWQMQTDGNFLFSYCRQGGTVSQHSHCMQAWKWKYVDGNRKHSWTYADYMELTVSGASIFIRQLQFNLSVLRLIIILKHS